MSGYVDPYPGRKGSERVTVECGKCSGSGIYHGPTSATFYTATVKDVAAGCFSCMGKGSRSVLVSSLRATARRRAKQAEEQEALAAKLRARRSEFDAAAGDLLKRVERLVEDLRSGDPLYDRAFGLVDDTRSSEAYENVTGWVASAERLLAEFVEREAAKKPVPVGRVQLSGVVLVTKFVENDFGGAYRMLVEGDGWKVWGSIPRAIADQAHDEFYDAEGWERRSADGVSVWSQVLIGRRVEFTATVKASDDDPAFGFFSRPAKAAICELV